VSSNDGELRRLLAEMKQAQVRHRRELRGRVDTLRVTATREDALAALELYADALLARRLPVPPAMQRDLRLLRVLCPKARRRPA
jgi:hypothetical protein